MEDSMFRAKARPAKGIILHEALLKASNLILLELTLAMY